VGSKSQTFISFSKTFHWTLFLLYQMKSWEQFFLENNSSRNFEKPTFWTTTMYNKHGDNYDWAFTPWESKNVSPKWRWKQYLNQVVWFYQLKFKKIYKKLWRWCSRIDSLKKGKSRRSKILPKPWIEWTPQSPRSQPVAIAMSYKQY